MAGKYNNAAPEKTLPLESERLIFKYFKASDLEFIHNFHNVPGVINDPNLKPPIPLSHAKSWLNNQLNSYRQEGIGHQPIYLKETGEFIGRNGLRIVEVVKGAQGERDQWYWYRGSAPKGFDTRAMLEIGYAFLPQYWNKGYATEATRALCTKAFEDNLSDRIVAAVAADNPASASVLEKCGFKQSGEVTGLGMDVIGYVLEK